MVMRNAAVRTFRSCAGLALAAVLGLGDDLRAEAMSLHQAVRSGDLEAAAGLLETGAAIDRRNHDGEVPLHIAVRTGNAAAVRLLLRHGAPLESRTLDGLTPLHLAAKGFLDARLEIAELLAGGGADVHARTPWGATPLHLAAFWGDLELARWLLDQGADPEARTGDRRTALQLAAQACRPAVERLLHDHLKDHPTP